MNDPLYIGIRFALYADLMLLFGLPLFARFTLGASASVARKPTLVALALLGIVLSFLSIAAMTASMMGVPLWRVDPVAIGTMVTETPMGRAWSVRMTALVLFIFAATASRNLPIPIALGAVALGSLAWTGHGAASEGQAGIVQLIADVVHLLAAGAWLGALAALITMLLSRSDVIATHRALDRFAMSGTIIVAAIVGSGLVNSAYLIGWSNIASVPTALYGQLLLAKLALFGAMLALAAANRFRLTPILQSAIACGDTDDSVRALRRSLAAEAGAAIAILALVAWLGTLEPPAAM